MNSRMFAIVSVLIASATLPGCSSPASKDSNAAHAADARIEKAEFYEPVLNLEVAVPGEARDGKLIEQAGEAILQIGKAMIAGRPPVKGQIDTINFTFHGPSDAGEGRTKFMHLTLDAQNLRELANMGADSETVLGSATEAGAWSPMNDDIVNDYCRDRSDHGLCMRLKG